MNIIIEPSEYWEIYSRNGEWNEYLTETVKASIKNNKLPIGMDIDYALEILKLCNEKGLK